MRKCKICGVNVASNANYCPLCYHDLDKDNSKDYPLTEIKTHNTSRKHIRRFLAKLFLLISIATFGICLFINLESKNTYLWSMLVLVSIVYLWILVAHTIMSKRSVFEKVVFQLLGIIAIVGTTYALSIEPAENWLVSYVMPGISMLAVAVMAFMSAISKYRKNYLLSFIVVYLGLLIVSVIFTYTIDSYHKVNNICILVCSIASVGTLLLGYKSIHKEFVKVFNL